MCALSASDKKTSQQMMFGNFSWRIYVRQSDSNTGAVLAHMSWGQKK
jgi:hypothetical protein